MLHTGFDDLRNNQGNEDLIKSIDSFFARELVISVEIEDEVQEYRIHEDPAHQMIILESPLSGPYCYEWDGNYWKSSTHAHYLEQFLVHEFI